MDSLKNDVINAIKTKNCSNLSYIFSQGWQGLGSGEQRQLSAEFIRSLINNNDESLVTTILESYDGMNAVEAALSHGPSTIDGGADNILRNLVFEFKVGQEDFSGAARVLAGLKLEDEQGSVYYASAAEKCDVYVKIAECHLENAEIAEADGAVTKAGTVLEQIDVEQNQPLILRYKSTYARVLDANRKFLQAAGRYYDLSQAHELVSPDELLLLLGRAVTCAILAPTGVHRQRVLGLVYNDQRVSQLDSIPSFETHSNILRKMYMNQVLRQSELVAFEDSLADHQKAITSDGITIVQRAVLEHNMVAVSSLYNTIYFDELGNLLGVSKQRAEKLACRMISDGKLSGNIDQVDGILSFVPKDEGLLAWDESIMNLCIQLNRVTDTIKSDQ